MTFDFEVTVQYTKTYSVEADSLEEAITKHHCGASYLTNESDEEEVSEVVIDENGSSKVL